MGNLKNFIDFRKESRRVNENYLNEGFFDVLGSGLNFLVPGIINTIKQKVIAFILERFGIIEKSPLSKVVQEVVDEIDSSEYMGILTGKNLNSEFLIPKFSSAAVDFLQRTGFDGIAESVGIETGGFLYNSIRESIEERLSNTGDLKKDIEKFLGSLLKNNEEDLFSALDPTKIVSDLPKSDRKRAMDKLTSAGKKVSSELGNAAKEEGAQMLMNLLKKSL